MDVVLLVGGMLGQERTVLPLLATDEFGLTAARVSDRASVIPAVQAEFGECEYGTDRRVTPDTAFPVGSITKAEIDDSENLWITAELDPTSNKAKELFIKVSKGNAVGRKPQLGLSVKGKATKYRFGIDPETQDKVTYLDHVLIEEVSVTSKPKNPTPYPLAIAKSLTADPEYTQALEDHMTTLSKNADANNDPISKAIAKAQEAREGEPTIAYSDGTETTNAQAAPSTRE